MAEEQTKEATGQTGSPRKARPLTLVALVVMAVALVIALWFHREQQEAETRLQLSQQFIVTALLKPASEKLAIAEQHVGELNYGHAEEYLGQVLTMFDSASPVLGQFGSADFLHRCRSSVEEARSAVRSLSVDSLKKIQAARRQIEIAEVLVAQESIGWAKEQARSGNFAEAKAFLAQASTLFEDATRVEGMETTSSQDWRDEVITSLAKAQRSLNDFAETSVAELTALSREFNKVGLAKAREFLWAAERQIATKDYTDAKQSLMEAATMFEKAQQVEGMERQDWIDDVVSGLGKAQKAVNDFAEKATPVIDRSLKALEQALSGR